MAALFQPLTPAVAAKSVEAETGGRKRRGRRRGGKGGRRGRGTRT